MSFNPKRGLVYRVLACFDGKPFLLLLITVWIPVLMFIAHCAFTAWAGNPNGWIFPHGIVHGVEYCLYYWGATCFGIIAWATFCSEGGFLVLIGYCFYRAILEMLDLPGEAVRAVEVVRDVRTEHQQAETARLAAKKRLAVQQAEETRHRIEEALAFLAKEDLPLATTPAWVLSEKLKEGAFDDVVAAIEAASLKEKEANGEGE